jgi:hypothetical protein
MAIKQKHEVRLRNGRAIDWTKPPKPTTICSWSKKTTGGRTIIGSFRTLCHMNRLNNLAVSKYGVEIQVIQPDWNTWVKASAGTHDYDATWDLWIPGVNPWEQQKFFRANGLGGWMRKPPLFGWHYHGFTLPPREGKSISDDFQVHGFRVGIYVDGGWSTRGALVTTSQIADYYNHAFGLSYQHRPGSDKTWFPKDIKATIFDLDAYVAQRAKVKPKPAPKPKPKPTKKTIAQVAKEVIDGKWGNGDTRIKKLKKAGYDPKKVQTKVNQILAKK